MDFEKVKSFEQLTRSMSRSQERTSTLGYLDERQANQVKERRRDRDGPAFKSPGRSRAEELPLDAPKSEIDPERLRAAREARERQERLSVMGWPRPTYRGISRKHDLRNVTTIGVDLAKNTFQLHGIDAHGKVMLRRTLRRNQVVPFFANLPSCLVGMEASPVPPTLESTDVV